MPSTDSFARRLDARVAEALDKRLVRRVSRRRRAWLATVAAFVLVTPVHLLSAVLAGGGITLIVLGGGWWPCLMGALLLGVAWTTRPHLGGGAAPESSLVDPVQAPLLAALVGDVADLLGTEAPREIRFDSAINAHVAPRGLRGRQLVLGAPLWAALGAQHRVALLGHELGHLAHGDLLDSRYVGSAYRTLGYWVRLLDPLGSQVFRYSTPFLVRAVMAPPRGLVRAYLRLLRAMNAASSRSQELHADLASAMVAGTAGAVGMLEVLLMDHSIDATANRVAIDPTRPDIGEAIASRFASYDDAQRLGARARGTADSRRIDASHPPTVDRLQLIESVEPSPAGIVLEADRSRLMDKELAPYLDGAFKQLGERYRYVR